TMAETIVRVECLKHVYPDNTTVDLCGLDFTVERGQRVAILGANGSGKSTLLHHLLGLLAPVEGRVEVFGEEPSRGWKKIRRRLGVVLQEAEEQIIGPTVWDDVTFSVRQAGWPAEQVRRRAEEVIGRLNLGHVTRRVPQYLSGGEKRRVAVAGAIIHQPELLILDEPFTGLDPASRLALLSLLRELNADGMAYVVATHEVALVPEIADYVYVLQQGRGIAQRGRPGELALERLAREIGLQSDRSGDTMNEASSFTS
ncbi:MAG TPA: ABC transporter ATP-binding protein, partial [Firmicutes bacterium]|nr:ABC transporter ATP-binding protein [Bacillota bacterium]